MEKLEMIGSKTQYVIILIFAALLSPNCNSQQVVEGNTMNDLERYYISIRLGESILTATLLDNPTTRDFISLLPLDLTLEDYSKTEKVSNPPKKLSIEDPPKGNDPSIGDITYYAPWGNLAIFYKDFGYASGLIILGRLDSGVEAFNVPGSLKVKIELNK